MDIDLSLNQLLNLGQLIVMAGGLLWGVFKVGRWFGELTGSIKDVLSKHEERLDEHGVRITKLEERT